ncbi:major facilitator superfamily domain-containing protein [Sporodiniella umbellata]|nr:major facilitator superfamily domain-containing protein [Sporodiniella umbellata]
MVEDRIEHRKEEEKQITRAIDLRLIPLLCLFYFMDYLDRANIGNASLAGIKDDLHLSSNQFSLIISIFYITYLIFEVPSNIILKRVGATNWLSSIMVVWGAITLAVGFTKSFEGLLVCRIILGAAESGYAPGIIYILSKVYRQEEFSKRLAIVMSMIALSSFVSGPIAYAVSFLDGRNNLYGWQYLFIVEGAPTVFLGIVSYFCLFDNVEDVSWLTDEQKAIHRSYTHSAESRKVIPAKKVLWAILDWKTALFSICYFVCTINLVSFQVFTPLIIDGFGFSVLNSQLLSAPPNILFGISIYTGGCIVDKHKNKRGIMIGIGGIISAIGYSLLLVLKDRWAKYSAVFIAAIGIGLQLVPNVGWTSVNFPDLDTRAVTIATAVMIGSVGGVVAPYLYPFDDSPNYKFGTASNVGVGLLSCLLSLSISYFLYRANRKAEFDTKNQCEDNNSQFRYTY